MLIRTATLSDMETLVKFRLLYLNAHFKGKGYDENEISKQLRDYFTRNIGNNFTAYFSQTDDNQIVSVMFVVKLEKPANPYFLTGKTALMMNVYTLPEYRRQGLADSLLKKVITDLKSEGVSCIDLNATDMGRPLYEKNGFKIRKDGESEMRLNL